MRFRLLMILLDWWWWIYNQLGFKCFFQGWLLSSFLVFLGSLTGVYRLWSDFELSYIFSGFCIFSLFSFGLQAAKLYEVATAEGLKPAAEPLWTAQYEWEHCKCCFVIPSPSLQWSSCYRGSEERSLAGTAELEKNLIFKLSLCNSAVFSFN